MTEITDVANVVVEKVGATLSRYGVEISDEEMEDLYELIVQIVEDNVSCR